DDYGHHPQEIKLTIESFKTHFPTQRLLLVFESHTFSRTEALLKDFAEALRLADLTFIMPIFASAREQAQPHSITPASFAAAVSPATLPLTWDTAAEQVWAESRPGDIILTMGAGFVYKLHTQFKQYAN
ncbi:TPA: UDP-N-acetylmuramate--L-alanine ligase, partial [Candidatus Collierbacteria bacterium]|nr:UDP-N-acetylmuramate--L-alanine ligase [Candidatus Collierbacteria bacterium]